ncbi:cobalamin-5'-phosphate synthase [Haladaptatus litoreus]|uniref:Adenosylcobinamide-GDP ribazoletransferase n=1 Tax=Haladaptatus litoreus TaxID=553468 RepID=A0A1N7CSQ6_9EURY|nr:adenosylcobinamide-GDP ribazoletransferase [Haladaptatus litoreus]SIR66686.1 cobalamin-5'-phosphate synthase [Haladaptatus litoreus]
MVLTAVRGALGFLSRLPVGHDESAWEAFRRSSVAFPLAGYVIGVFLAIPLLFPLPTPVDATLFLATVYGVTGINHVDGLADLGDAAAVHGAEKRRTVMKDTDVGVGALLAVALLVVGLALAAVGLVALPLEAIVAIVVTAEVSSKLGMAGLAAFGSSAHEGLGSQLIDQTPRGFVLAVVVSVPTLALSWSPLVGIAMIGTSLLTTAVVGQWARSWLGGVSGDVFGATNELSRLVALHVGVVMWTLF